MGLIGFLEWDFQAYVHTEPGKSESAELMQKRSTSTRLNTVEVFMLVETGAETFVSVMATICHRFQTLHFPCPH